MICGGLWLDDACYVRAAYSSRLAMEDRSDNLGFRCARAHVSRGCAAAQSNEREGVIIEPFDIRPTGNVAKRENAAGSCKDGNHPSLGKAPALDE
jgi:hypothetical protein